MCCCRPSHTLARHVRLPLRRRAGRGPAKPLRDRRDSPYPRWDSCCGSRRNPSRCRRGMHCFKHQVVQDRFVQDHPLAKPWFVGDWFGARHLERRPLRVWFRGRGPQGVQAGRSRPSNPRFSKWKGGAPRGRQFPRRQHNSTLPQPPRPTRSSSVRKGASAEICKKGARTCRVSLATITHSRHVQGVPDATQRGEDYAPGPPPFCVRFERSGLEGHVRDRDRRKESSDGAKAGGRVPVRRRKRADGTHVRQGLAAVGGGVHERVHGRVPDGRGREGGPRYVHPPPHDGVHDQLQSSPRPSLPALDQRRDLPLLSPFSSGHVWKGQRCDVGRVGARHLRVGRVRRGAGVPPVPGPQQRRPGGWRGGARRGEQSRFRNAELPQAGRGVDKRAADCEQWEVRLAGAGRGVRRPELPRRPTAFPPRRESAADCGRWEASKQ